MRSASMHRLPRNFFRRWAPRVCTLPTHRIHRVTHRARPLAPATSALLGCQTSMASRWLQPEALVWGGRLQRGVALAIAADGTCESAGLPPPDATVERLAGKLLLPGLVNAHSHAFQRLLRGRTQAPAPGRRRGRLLDLARDDVPRRRRARSGRRRSRLPPVLPRDGPRRHHHRGRVPLPPPRARRPSVRRSARARAPGRLRRPRRRPAHPPPPRRLRAPGIRRRPRATPAPLLRPGPGHASSPPSRRSRSASVPTRWSPWAPPRTASAPSPARGSRPSPGPDPARCTCTSPSSPARSSPASPSTAVARSSSSHELGLLDARFTAVHAVHLAPHEIPLLGRSSICACPLTERDLGDGILPADALAAAGATLCIGTDGQTRDRPARRAPRARGRTSASSAAAAWSSLRPARASTRCARTLLEVGTQGGARSLGLDVGRLAPGRPADLCAVDLTHPALAGAPEDGLLAAVVFSAPAAAVTDTWVQGERVVQDGHHPHAEAAARDFRALCRRTFA